MILAQLELSPEALHWVYLVLIWIGFGAVVGMLAKAVLPGREPQGSFGVLAIGVLGSMIGPLILTSALKFESFNPISPLGFLVSVAGAVVLLVSYRAVLLLAADALAGRRTIAEPGEYEEYEDEDDYEYEYVYR